MSNDDQHRFRSNVGEGTGDDDAYAIAIAEILPPDPWQRTRIAAMVFAASGVASGFDDDTLMKMIAANIAFIRDVRDEGVAKH